MCQSREVRSSSSRHCSDPGLSPLSPVSRAKVERNIKSRLQIARYYKLISQIDCDWSLEHILIRNNCSSQSSVLYLYMFIHQSREVSGNTSSAIQRGIITMCSMPQDGKAHQGRTDRISVRWVVLQVMIASQEYLLSISTSIHVLVYMCSTYPSQSI